MAKSIQFLKRQESEFLSFRFLTLNPRMNKRFC